QRILQRPAASSATVPPPVFPPPQNAVVAPLVAQIHAHRQTVEIGAKPTSVCFSPVLATTTFGSSFSLSFPTNSASTFFMSCCTGPRDFARFDVGSLFFR